MARAWEKVNTRRPRPRARTPIPIRSSTCSRLRKAIRALDGNGVHKAGRLGSQVRERSIRLSSEDRPRAEGRRLRQRPEREAFRLGDNLLSEGVDRHLRLLLRLTHPDDQVPALDL